MGYILITGGNLINKGAQAMTFIAVEELKKRFPEKEIVVISDIDAARSDEELSHYRFLFRDGVCLFGKKYKLVQHRYGRLDRHGDAAYIRKHAEMVIDVSGYTFGTNWGFLANMLAAYRTRQAWKLHIPIYYMPQSFGPIAQKGLRWKIFDHYFKKWFYNGLYMFYCRETEGCDLLRIRYSMVYVRYAVDMVLANRGVDRNAIFQNMPPREEDERAIAQIEPHSVGILPNVRNDRFGTAEKMDRLYRRMIDRLLAAGRTVYLIRHAIQDMECCRRIKNYYRDEKRVVLLENDFDCFAYSRLAARFDYLIASRYHAVVHAYKEGTPCIVPGWAVKYQELLQLFDQEKYVFDVRTAEPEDTDALIAAMEENYGKEAALIREKLAKVQRENVFDLVKGGRSRRIGDAMPGRKVIEQTAYHRKCVSCGICAAVCPAECIRFERIDGYYLPRVTEEACVNCRRCDRVCYGGVTEGDIPFKIPQRALTARAKDEQILLGATSGGAVTALVGQLLKDGVYDNAYLVEGFGDKQQLFTREFLPGEDLSGTQKSRYVPVSQQYAVSGILANPDKRSIYVGSACAVYGLLEALKLSGMDRDRVLIIGLFCDRSQMYSLYDYFREHFRRKEPRRGNMTELYFRDKRAGGWPGNMRAVFEDGSSIDISAKERMIVKDFFRPRRCVTCTDKLNRLADISVGDNYTGKNSDKRGSNSVLIYTDRGAAAWERCEDQFETFESTVEEICRSQHTTWENAFGCTRDGKEKVEPKEISDLEALEAMADYALGEWGLYPLIEKQKKEKLKKMYKRALRERLHL